MKVEASGADWKEPHSKESNIRIWNSRRALRDKCGHHPRRSAGCKEKTTTEILIPGTGEEEMGKRKRQEQPGMPNKFQQKVS